MQYYRCTGSSKSLCDGVIKPEGGVCEHALHHEFAPQECLLDNCRGVDNRPCVPTHPKDVDKENAAIKLRIMLEKEVGICP